MKICGIIAEYNPFHLGHAHQIRETRARLGEDCAIVALMSGDFVQRGEAALLPKQARASMALQAGADLVLELPLPWALSSAERFAAGGVSILSRLGCVTHLSFGAECGDLKEIQSLAALLLEQQTIQDTIAEMQTGISFAAARERALFRQVQERAQLLRQPNNILAMEYCKAILAQGSPLEPVLIPRQGALHDGPVQDGTASASEIRRRIRAGEEYLSFLPEENRGLMEYTVQTGHALVNTDRLETMMLDRLVRLSPEELGQLPDATEGIEHRLHRSIREHRSIDAMVCDATTRRYPAARLRRMLCCAFLGLTRADSRGLPPYVKVLGFNDRGRRVLSLARKTVHDLPVLTKPAHGTKLPREARALLNKEALAADLYDLALPAWRESRSGAEWVRGPLYLSDKTL